MLTKTTLTHKPEWQALNAHYGALKHTHLNDLFRTQENRFEDLHLELDGLLFDYSKNVLTPETIAKLADLARACDLEGWREKMFTGAAINNTEDRAVLHTALRTPVDDSLQVNDEAVGSFVKNVQAQIKNISETIRIENKFTDVIHIGIGGSDLGPKMVCEALKHRANGPEIHFVSNIDAAQLNQVLEKVNQETTLIIIASKTFTTLETMTNARTAKAWLAEKIDKSDMAKHLIGLTANTKAAEEFGIAPDRVLPLRDWVGGRYSVWSAIGLPIAIACGYDAFDEFLNGARTVDEHFRSAPLEQNMPVLMALIGIWHRNFFGYGAYAVLPYAENLKYFPDFIQQLDMESNGKHVDRDGREVDYPTGPLIFGQPGTNGQHAFYQLLHQGTDITPCDFLAVATSPYPNKDHHDALLANALAQSEAMMRGKPSPDAPHKDFKGNRPSSTFVIPRLDPHYIGMLIALYEHKIFVQGIIWNLNSFDQWGVELGKKLAGAITTAIEQGKDIPEYSASTNGLLRYLRTAGQNTPEE